MAMKLNTCVRPKEKRVLLAYFKEAGSVLFDDVQKIEATDEALEELIVSGRGYDRTMRRLSYLTEKVREHEANGNDSDDDEEGHKVKTVHDIAALV